MPVSSSRLRNVTPPAVAGRCRWVTAPPTSTRVPCLDPSPARPPDRARVPSRAVADELGRDSCRARCRWPTRRPPSAPRRPCRAARGVEADRGAGQPVRARPAPRHRPPTAPRRRSSAEAARTRRRWPAPPAAAVVSPHPAGQVGMPGTARSPSRSADDPLGELVADRADRGQAEPDRRAARAVDGRFQGGVREAGVDVRAADGDAVPAGVGDQRLRRVEAHRLGAQQRRAERRRVVAA